MRKLIIALLRPFVLPIVEEGMSSQRERYREQERALYGRSDFRGGTDVDVMPILVEACSGRVPCQASGAGERERIPSSQQLSQGRQENWQS
ncbi:MAG: hypothetical protein J0H82_30370 [Alphaproteobacteria bacterium]|nr:hypothetical protein [Alphaproteobacteria bacterium]